MNANINASSDTADREIVITRLVDAPRELVFAVWTDPQHVANWWGPSGFTTTTHEMDVRPGGVWRFDMHGPDGTDYPNHIAFTEVVRPERLAYDHGGEAAHADFRVTVTFDEQQGKTRVTLRSVFASAAERDRSVEFGAVEGGEQTLARLAQQVAELGAHAADAFVLTRVFDAPRELVFQLWTQAEHLARWWGPKGFTLGVSSLDLRPGGVFHYSMRSPAGHEMWGKFVYCEVSPPSRLVFINSFADAAGNVTRHPGSATWPLEVLSTLEFSEQDGKTTLTMRGVPHHATEVERRTFREGHKSMEGGFGGTFAQLREYLATLRG